MEDVSRVGTAKAGFWELLISALVLSSAVNIACTVILSDKFGLREATILSVTVVVIASFLLYIFLRSYFQMNRAISIEGVLRIDKSSPFEVKDIPEYEFSERLKSFMSAIFSENPAIEKQWIKAKDLRDLLGESESAFGRSLLVEAIEYYVIARLSTHLTDYFNARGLSGSNRVAVFGRKDLPGVLLENRFLELFSRPMDQRDAFSDGIASSGRGVVVMAFSAGAIFHRLELNLPKYTSVTRLGPGKIRIKHMMFSLTIDVEVSGSAAMYPRRFGKLYLGEDLMDQNPRRCAVQIDVKYSPFIMFIRSGREFNGWIEAFVSKMHKEADFGEFVRGIEWSNILATERVMRGKLVSEGGGATKPTSRAPLKAAGTKLSSDKPPLAKTLRRPPKRTN